MIAISTVFCTCSASLLICFYRSLHIFICFQLFSVTPAEPAGSASPLCQWSTCPPSRERHAIPIPLTSVSHPAGSFILSGCARTDGCRFQLPTDHRCFLFCLFVSLRVLILFRLLPALSDNSIGLWRLRNNLDTESEAT